MLLPGPSQPQAVTAPGIWGTQVWKEGVSSPSAVPQDRAVPSCLQHLVTPSPQSELWVLPGAAQNVTNPRTARRKPKGCQNCPRPQSLELPDHLLYSWGLSGTPP